MRISDWSSDVCSSDLIGGIIDEREEQSAAKARPEKAVDRACKPGSAECIGARRGKIDPHALGSDRPRPEDEQAILPLLDAAAIFAENARALFHRSEEHTSELQSLMRISYAVFCLKKTTTNRN